MSWNDSEWKDWAWIKAQARERPAFWIAFALWFGSGFLSVIPFYVSKGHEAFYVGTAPLFAAYFSLRLAWAIPHAVLTGFLGLVISRSIAGAARRIRRPDHRR